jgi:hypothetical protein
VSLGFYVPGIWVSLEAGDLRDGVCFYDPYCERTFRSVASYRSHAVRCGHPAAVDVRFVSEGPRRHRDEDCAEQHWR